MLISFFFFVFLFRCSANTVYVTTQTCYTTQGVLYIDIIRGSLIGTANNITSHFPWQNLMSVRAAIHTLII